ncbi:unnamed protein product [Symbiodinium microadriaticum]|nr:unnamed protein product [Symbiodinium microadriaticum]
MQGQPFFVHLAGADTDEAEENEDAETGSEKIEEMLQANKELLKVTLSVMSDQNMGVWPVPPIQKALKEFLGDQLSELDLHGYALGIKGACQTCVRMTKKSKQARRKWMQEIKDCIYGSELTTRKPRKKNTAMEDMETQEIQPGDTAEGDLLLQARQEGNPAKDIQEELDEVVDQARLDKLVCAMCSTGIKHVIYTHLRMYVYIYIPLSLS